MNIGRYVIGFAAGCCVMYFAMTSIDRIAPKKFLAAPDAQVETSQALTTPFSPQEMKILKAQAALSTATAPDSVPDANPSTLQPLPEPPSIAELNARMASLRMSEQQAKDALAKLGPVKLNAVIRREEEIRKSIAAQTVKNPNEQMNAAADTASNPAFQSEEQLNEYRRSRFKSYVDNVHSSEKEVLHKNQDGPACSEQNCLVPH